MKKSNRNFIIFWIISGIFLVGWYFFWQVKNDREFKTLSSVIDFLPIDELKKAKFKTMASFAEYAFQKDGQEKTFMILFQNNLELRPGGGYIGSFGILKLKDGQVEQLQTHDLSNFDGRVPDGIETPYPFKEALHVSDWKLRDSNWSPDFPTDAQKADYFYHLGQGQENFDGVIAIDSNVLISFLKVTGPVTIDGYPGTYDSENAVLSLEHQVEQGYAQQGIERGDRKNVMNLLAEEIKKKVLNLNVKQKLQLAEIILEDLNRKDIQLYFKDPNLEYKAKEAQWDGSVDQGWTGDYLMMVDANMGSLKSDYYVKRSFKYTIDLTGDKPKADLLITYTHTAKEKDWMTKDYLDYLRVYVPSGGWLVDSQNLGEKRFGDDLGKKYFGTLVNVPLGRVKTIGFSYTLPQSVAENYDLLIQRQAGSGDVRGEVDMKYKSGQTVTYQVDLAQDWKLSAQ